MIDRPEATPDSPQHLCADRGYTGEPALRAVVGRGYTPHIKTRGEEREEKRCIPGYRARRWVVEACHSWLNRFRKILVRFEKTDPSYVALLSLACAIICWRHAHVI